MATKANRQAVTAIVATTPGAHGHRLDATSEIVPMREELFPLQQLAAPGGISAALQKVQRHIAETTQAARSLPVLGGAYFPNVPFTANTAQTLTHGLQGGVTVAFLIARKRALSSNVACDIVETAQDPATGRLTLLAVPVSVGLTADVWVFPQPAAVQP